jgi:hypothetical protein
MTFWALALRRKVVLYVLAVGAACGAGAQAAAQACTSSSCRSFVSIEGADGVTVYRSFDLASGSPTVRRMVIVVHGSQRNAYGVFSNIVSAAQAVDTLDETLIVAPLFKTAADLPGANDLYWTDGGWKSGDDSVGLAVSSFDVVDRIVASVVEGAVFPGLELVTVVGHSAGGQFTQRYAAGNPTQQAYPALKFNYVVMNASSYLYLNGYRPVAGTVDQFAVPSGCRDYDEYKYGLGARNRYMAGISAPVLLSQYPLRHVTYLVGVDDVSRTNDLDTSCEGEAQGYTRYERGVAYWNHIEKYYPVNRHSLGSVPGVGHDSYGMSSSAAGKAAILPDPRAIPATAVGPVPDPPSQLDAS